MRHRKIYDVIVVGAGPGGALLAHILADSGLDVLVLEKKSLPRYKTCGGGLTVKTLKVLPFDISPVVEDDSMSAMIRVKGQPVFHETFNEPVIRMVMRDRFDFFLVQKAAAAGAEIKDEVIFKSISGSAGKITVDTSAGSFRTRVIAGADGVYSKTAKALGLKVNCKKMTALEGEVFFSDQSTVKKYKNSVCFDFGVIPKGYGWIFPKRNHLSTGILTCSEKTTSINDYFASYLKTSFLNSFPEVRRLKGHLIPYSPDKMNIIAEKRGLLLGDAAGYTDPVTGEGIYHAVRTAEIASGVLINSIKNGYEHMETYNCLVREEFELENACAEKFARLLYDFPKISHTILKKRGQTLGKYHMDVVSGNKTYTELHRKFFSIPKITAALFKSFFSNDIQ